jgi:beta-glucosidase
LKVGDSEIGKILTRSGYHVKFGMQYVNFTTYERDYKASFFEYVNAFKLYAEDPVTPVYVQ